MNHVCLFCEFQKVGLNGSTSDIFSFLHVQLENLHVYPSKFQSFSFPSAVERLFTFAVFKSLFHSILATKCGSKKNTHVILWKMIAIIIPSTNTGALKFTIKKRVGFQPSTLLQPILQRSIGFPLQGGEGTHLGTPKSDYVKPRQMNASD